MRVGDNRPGDYHIRGMRVGGPERDGRSPGSDFYGEDLRRALGEQRETIRAQQATIDELRTQSPSPSTLGGLDPELVKDCSTLGLDANAVHGFESPVEKKDIATAAFTRRAKYGHPDVGGSDERMRELIGAHERVSEAITTGRLKADTSSKVRLSVSSTIFPG